MSWWALSSLIVSPTAVYDMPSSTSFAGLDVHLVGNQARGIRPVGRLSGGVDPELRFAGLAELGFVVAVQTEEVADVRAGLKGRATYVRRDYPVPFGMQVDEEVRSGAVPVGLFFAELAWTPDAPAVIGGEFGFGPWGGVAAECWELADPPNRCIEWPVGFVVSAYARKTFKSGFTLSASAGLHSRIAVGYAF